MGKAQKRVMCFGDAKYFLQSESFEGTENFEKTWSLRNPKKAVGTVEITEPIISFTAVIVFGILFGFENFLWSIVIPIMIGGIILTPISAYLTKKIPKKWFGILVGLWLLILNLRTVLQSLGVL